MTAPETTPAPSDNQYAAYAHATLTAIESQIDQWLQMDVIDIDSHRTGGLLELVFPNGSKIIINTQPPLQELWLAAKSGGYHFKLINNHWLDTKSGQDFYHTLSVCASEHAGQPLNLVAPNM